MSKPDTTKIFVKKLNAKYINLNDQWDRDTLHLLTSKRDIKINKYITNNLINEKIINEIPKEKYKNIFK